MCHKASLVLCFALLLLSEVGWAQLIDNTQAPNTAKAGINKSLQDEIGAGRGDVLTPNSSIYLINRDPFRSIRRGRQLFQRKFTQAQGQGPNEGDGSRRHQYRYRHRRRTLRQLRLVPRSSARLGGHRRKRQHPARQPRLSAPVRSRLEGNAGRRDHDRSAQHARSRHRARTAEQALRHPEADEQRNSLRQHHGKSRRLAGYIARYREWMPICA